MTQDPGLRVGMTLLAVTIIAAALAAILFRPGSSLKPLRGGAFEWDEPPASSASRADK
jgi:hypothetical protein